jgi:hypothetical protein
MMRKLMERTLGGSEQITVPNQPGIDARDQYDNNEITFGKNEVGPDWLPPLPGFQRKTRTRGSLGEGFGQTNDPMPLTRNVTRSTRLNLPEADRQAMGRAIVGNSNKDSQLRNKRAAAERQINTARDKVYGSGAGDLVGARVNAYNLRRQGVTPFTRQRDEMMAMLRAYGVGI